MPQWAIKAADHVLSNLRARDRVGSEMIRLQSDNKAWDELRATLAAIIIDAFDGGR